MRRAGVALFSGVLLQLQSGCRGLSQQAAVVPRAVWLGEARRHSEEMNDLLYPLIPGHDQATLKERMHAVRLHPVYNFLHSYYRYSAEELKLFSPGILSSAPLEISSSEDLSMLHQKFLSSSTSLAQYQVPRQPLEPSGRYGWVRLSKSRDILQATSNRQPFLACFGLHEWAMLFKSNEKKQPSLSLRVPQSKIDEVVAQGTYCTHFDAFRHFSQTAMPLNSNPSLTRDTQVETEQPGCIHATMDLFAFAHKIYPLSSSSLLRRSLQLALKARKIDMRASPYDVSKFDGCEIPICIETADGRKQYADEQLALAQEAAPLREEILQTYNAALHAALEV